MVCIRLAFVALMFLPIACAKKLDSAEAYIGRGMAYAHEDKYDQAIEDFSEAIRLAPDKQTKCSGYLNRGRGYRSKKEYGKFVEDFFEAIRLSPQSDFAYQEIAWVLATCPNNDVRDGRKAIQFATMACRLNEWEDITSLVTLAAAYAEFGDFDEAGKRMREAIRLASCNGHDCTKTRLEKALLMYQNGKVCRDE